jgi:transcriptional regulator with XRE-family HTH domain
VENIKKIDITPAHLRAARAWLDWTLEEAAIHSGYTLYTLSRIECGAQPFSKKAQANLAKVFEHFGVRFTERGIEAV